MTIDCDCLVCVAYLLGAARRDAPDPKTVRLERRRRRERTEWPGLDAIEAEGRCASA